MGFRAGTDLVKEVKQRQGKELEWAVSEARRRIHDNDTEGLRQLLAEYPALLSWRTDEDDSGLLGMATGSCGESGDPVSEEHFMLQGMCRALTRRRRARRAVGVRGPRPFACQGID